MFILLVLATHLSEYTVFSPAGREWNRGIAEALGRFHAERDSRRIYSLKSRRSQKDFFKVRADIPQCDSLTVLPLKRSETVWD